MRISTCFVCAFVVVLAAGRCGAQTVVYSEDFEARSSFPEWSTVATDPAYQNPIKTERSPLGGRRFLGRFGAQQATLTLTGLKRHDTVIVEFDWFILASMDGADPFYAESFTIAEPSAGVAYCTSFSNFDFVADPSARQAFPGTCGAGDFPPKSGAAERNTLGYSFARAGDAVYRMRLVFAHTNPTLALSIAGEGLQELYDESWGIDNMKVSIVAQKSGIAARSQLLFTGRPCSVEIVDTLWVRSLGPAPLTLDSVVVAGAAGAFVVAAPPLPLEVPPGDSIPLVVRALPQVPGVHTAAALVYSDAEPSPFAIELRDTLLPGQPWVADREASCDRHVVTIADSCGIAALALLDGSENVTLEADPPPPAPGTRALVRLIDPAKPGRYVLAANGIQVAGGTIDPTAILDAPSAPGPEMFGADGCGSVPVHNRGADGVWLNAAAMAHNTAFSVPPSQLPLWIPAGETRDLIVCYRPGDGAEYPGDTLRLETSCHTMMIAFTGTPGGFSGTASNCGAAIGFRSIGAAKPVVIVHPVSVERAGTSISLLVEQAAAHGVPAADITVALYNLAGSRVGEALPGHVSETVRDGIRTTRRWYRADIAECDQGGYLLVASAPDGLLVQRFVVLR